MNIEEYYALRDHARNEVEKAMEEADKHGDSVVAHLSMDLVYEINKWRIKHKLKPYIRTEVDK